MNEKPKNYLNSLEIERKREGNYQNNIKQTCNKQQDS